MTPETIELILRDDVERAKQFLAESKDGIDNMLASARHPDGRLYLKQAKPVYNQAWEDYMLALTRLWDFMIHGKIPEDLQGPEAAPEEDRDDD